MEVPLPLREAVDAPVVVRGSLFGAVELAAGSPLTAPRPLGEPACCAAALTIDRASTAAVTSNLFISSSRGLDGFLPPDNRSDTQSVPIEEQL